MSANFNPGVFATGVRLTGNSRDNWLAGGDFNDTMLGYAGSDILDGGAGFDLMVGGVGNDIYYRDDHGDRIIERENGGYDIVISSVWGSIPDNVEELWLVGDAVVGIGSERGEVLLGNATHNLLYGYGGDDTLVGGDGADGMSGGKGNDSYYRDDTGDSINEYAYGGHDTVYAFVSTTLSVHVEDLTLSGNAIVGIGNAEDNYIRGGLLDNRLFGAVGDDTLRGGGFDDTLTGGRGADLFIFDHGQDVISDFRDDVDSILLADVWGDAPQPSIDELLAGARVVNGDLVIGLIFDHVLTLRNFTDASALRDDLSIMAM